MSSVNSFKLTIFNDLRGKTKHEITLDTDELAERIRRRSAPTKESLPLGSFATFGDEPSKDGCLRHDANAKIFSGIWVEHDAGTMSFEEAHRLIVEARISSVIYTTPSHRPEKPRWRAGFPFEGCMIKPQGYRNMVDRANALFGGVLSGESWTVRQSYYLGHIEGDAHFRCEVTEGDFIDVRRDLGAQGKALGDGHVRANGHVAGDIGGLPEKVLKIIRTGDSSRWNNDRSRAVFYLACQLVRAGWDDNQISAVLLDPAHGISAHTLDQNKPPEYALRQARNARAEVEADWERNWRGEISAGSLKNVRRALGALHISARHDVFANRSLVTVGGAETFLDDAVAERLWLAIEENFQFRPPREFFETVLRDLARQNSFHPVHDYLAGLKWDGDQRIDDWLFKYGRVPRRGGEYDRYVRAVGRIMLIAAVRRVRHPGCKFDEMLVLASEKQGLNKSTVLAVLAVRPDWFTDSIDLGAKDKEAIEQLDGKWIVEIAELRGHRRNDIDRIKAFLSRQYDRARLAFGRLPTERPRACVFFSSTNDVKFLKDRTGNRRYWPVLDVEFDVEALERDRDQLWAEAAAAEAQGESIRLPQELWAVAETVQNESLEEEPWVDVIKEALGVWEGKIRSADVWKILDIDPRLRTPESDNRMGRAMRELGWVRKQRRFGHDPEWAYVKGTGEKPIVVSRDPVTKGAFSVAQGGRVRTVVDGEVTEGEALTKQDVPF